jgi:hypothetical protein
MYQTEGTLRIRRATARTKGRLRGNQANRYVQECFRGKSHPGQPYDPRRHVRNFDRGAHGIGSHMGPRGFGIE